MKNIKETIIGVFAVIGFVVVASGFTTNNEAQEPTYGTPESHVWEFHQEYNTQGTLAINKVTGEVKAYAYRLSPTKSVVFGLKVYTAKEIEYGSGK